ncbi:uncharacterized protein LOC117096930 [Trachypithecus francoisi]|uniref:uncharacterized protein LOC117096930 n=1 Tax=Trachypithecus francoisi TaxID=54180 RepID=UPI00141B160E|nr:uncharacterized protein LOC117096930 [Trachypithecus francoisi]
MAPPGVGQSGDPQENAFLRQPMGDAGHAMALPREPIRAQGTECAHRERRGWGCRARSGNAGGRGFQGSCRSSRLGLSGFLHIRSPPTQVRPSALLLKQQAPQTLREARRPLTYDGPRRRDDDHGI